MTAYQADAKIKAIYGPFARAIDREEKTWNKFYVGWMPYYGVGQTWEEAFANIKHYDRHHTARPYKRTCKCAKCRAPKEVLQRRSLRYD